MGTGWGMQRGKEWVAVRGSVGRFGGKLEVTLVNLNDLETDIIIFFHMPHRLDKN